MVQEEKQELVQSILAKRGEISSIIPPTMELAELERNLRACRDGVGINDKRGNFLKLVLGSAMLMTQHHPKIWRDSDCESWEDWCRKNIYRPGFERATAQKYKMISDKWGAEDIVRIAKIPLQHMVLISKVTDQSRPSAAKYLEAAETKGIEELQEFVEGEGHHRDTTTSVMLKLPCSLEQLRDIQRFVGLPEVCAITDTDNPAENLLCAIRDFCGTHGISA